MEVFILYKNTFGVDEEYYPKLKSKEILGIYLEDYIAEKDKIFNESKDTSSWVNYEVIKFPLIISCNKEMDTKELLKILKEKKINIQEVDDSENYDEYYDEYYFDYSPKGRKDFLTEKEYKIIKEWLNNGN